MPVTSDEMEKYLKIPQRSAKKKIDTLKVKLWVSGIENLRDSNAVLSKISAAIGVLQNPFNLLSSQDLFYLDKKGITLGLYVPTRTRVPGSNESQCTLYNHQESIDSLQKKMKPSNMNFLFFPHSTDLDLSVIPAISEVKKKYSVTLLLAPQLISTVSESFKRSDLKFHVVDGYVSPDMTNEDIRLYIFECLQVLKITGEQQIVFTLTQNNVDLFFEFLNVLNKASVELEKSDDNNHMKITETEQIIFNEIKELSQVKKTKNKKK
jgi:hypothetical protein